MNRLNLLDRGAMLITFILCGLGVLFIRSATAAPYLSGNLWIKQIMWVVLGGIFYLIISQIDYKRLVTHAHFFFIGGVVLLVFVLLFGSKINGARSWFRLPFMSFQPSEVMKIATVLMVAKYFSRFQERQSSLLEFVVSSLFIGVPVCLILMQPDLGTALCYVPFFVIPNFFITKNNTRPVTMPGSTLYIWSVRPT